MALPTGLAGLGGGAAGTNFAAPAAAPIQQVTSPAGVAGVNTGVNSTQALLAALQGQLASQNGIARQNSGTQMLGGLASTTNPLGAAGTAAQTGAMGGTGNLNQALTNANGVGTQQGAIGQLQNVYGSQANTLGQLQGIANGTGANPAQAMLNQQTGQNVAQQAALMAGQRGAGANVGLMARQLAQQGAATQQAAVGQGASMQAQQSLNALNQMQTQQQAMSGTQQAIGGLGTTQVGQLQAGQGQLSNMGQTAANTAQTAAGAYTGQGNNLVGQQLTGATTGIQGALGAQSNLYNAVGAANTAGVGMQSNINSANMAGATAQMAPQYNVLSGAAQGLAAGLGTALGGGSLGTGTAAPVMTEGASPTVAPTESDMYSYNPAQSYNPAGPLQYGSGYAEGGEVSDDTDQTPQTPAAPASSSSNIPNADSSYNYSGVDQPQNQPASAFGQFLKGYQTSQVQPGAQTGINGNATPISSGNYGTSSAGGQSPITSVSPVSVLSTLPVVGGAVAALANMANPKTKTTLQNSNEYQTSSPQNFDQKVGGFFNNPLKSIESIHLAKGGSTDYRSGGHVKAGSLKQKAVKSGNSYANDKVPAMLSEGEIVIPRSVLQSKDPVRGAADFVRKTLAKKRAK